MLFGIRPEHLTDKQISQGQEFITFQDEIIVVEPTGLDTMVLININGIDIWARSNPRVVGRVGENMSFSIDMNNMFLIDPDTKRVI